MLQAQSNPFHAPHAGTKGSGCTDTGHPKLCSPTFLAADKLQENVSLVLVISGGLNPLYAGKQSHSPLAPTRSSSEGFIPARMSTSMAQPQTHSPSGQAAHPGTFSLMGNFLRNLKGDLQSEKCGGGGEREGNPFLNYLPLVVSWVRSRGTPRRPGSHPGLTSRLQTSSVKPCTTSQPVLCTERGQVELRK